jgi:hypothetical protein
VTKHAEYSPKPFSAELVSGEVGAPGAHYRTVGWVPNEKQHVNEVEVVEATPGERIVFRSDDELGPFTNTYVLRPSDGGTEVEWTLEFPPLTGVAALMVPVLFPIVGKPDGRKRMRSLKAKAEAAA